MLELLRNTSGVIIIGVPPLILKNHTRTAFYAQRSLSILNEIVSRTRAQRETIFDIRNRIVQPLDAAISVPALGKKPVVLQKSPQAFVVLHIIVFAIRRVRFQMQLV